MLTTGPKRRVQLPSESFPGAHHVRQELDRILDSATFKATPRRKKLLRYLVEELLAGRGRELKGYTIATVVFERDDSFDPQTDPVVRLEARRLRHDLDGYYVSAGRSNPLRIAIPKGQYVPVIEWESLDTGGSPAELPPAILAAIPPPGEYSANASRTVRRALLTAAVAVVSLLSVFAYALLRLQTEPAGSPAAANGTALAVLPFDVEGDNPKNALLARGMADEIMSGINRFGVFRLYMPSAIDSTLAGSDPIDVGNRLKLPYVVNGTINADKGDGTLRVDARLIEVKSQRILWIGSYDRNYSTESLRAVPQEIATAIASALGQSDNVLRTSDPTPTAEAAAASIMGEPRTRASDQSLP